MATVLGLDYGERRIGVAKAETDDGTAVVVGTLDVQGIEDAVLKVVRVIEEREATTVVIGLPLGLTGADTAQTTSTRAFITALEQRVDVPVVTIDERLTTKQGGTDAGAAVVLLQSYLDREAHE